MILLLDLDPREGLCEGLRVLLETAFRSETTIQQKSVGYSDPAHLKEDLSAIKSTFSPNLTFVTLPPSILNQTRGILESIIKELPEIPIIAVVSEREADTVLGMLQLGATEFVAHPLRAIDIVPRVRRLLERTRRAQGPVRALKERLGMKHLIGESASFLAELRKFPLVAECDASILIVGETGTGKELCARAIHYLSPRATGPFLPVNCGAIPADLVENEMFGHEREAFTGASTSRAGLIHEADAGTLFLDEVDCLPPSAQVKLLRFLQEKEYRPLGSTVMRRADVRVIAASNIDLEEAVRSRRLRQDLYYRLNVIPLALPPLRERQSDIPLLARHFLAKYAGKFAKTLTDFSPSAMQMLLSYDWPGNIRELEHVIERAIVLSEQETIHSYDLGLKLSQGNQKSSFQETKARMIAKFESGYIQALLSAHQGNVTRAAEAASKDRRAFRQLIRKHKIDVRSFKGA